MRKSEFKLKQEQKEKLNRKNGNKENSEAAFVSYVPDCHTTHTWKTFLPPAPDWPGVSERQHFPSLKRVRRSDIQPPVQLELKPNLVEPPDLSHVFEGGCREGESRFCAVAMAVLYSYIWAGGSIRLWEGKPWGL